MGWPAAGSIRPLATRNTKHGAQATPQRHRTRPPHSAHGHCRVRRRARQCCEAPSQRGGAPGVLCRAAVVCAPATAAHSCGRVCTPRRAGARSRHAATAEMPAAASSVAGHSRGRICVAREGIGCRCSRRHTHGGWRCEPQCRPARMPAEAFCARLCRRVVRCSRCCAWPGLRPCRRGATRVELCRRHRHGWREGAMQIAVPW